MAKGKVTINEVICKGCGLCVSVCPKRVLRSFYNKNQSRRLQSRRNDQRRLYRLHKLRKDVP